MSIADRLRIDCGLILDQFVGQGPLTAEELDAVVRRFKKAMQTCIVEIRNPQSALNPHSAIRNRQSAIGNNPQSNIRNPH